MAKNCQMMSLASISRVVFPIGRPTLNGSAPGQFTQIEWLGEVNIGTALKAARLVLEGVARGQHQHRHILRRLRLDRAADVEAIEIRQIQVEQDHVVMVAGGQRYGQRAVAGMVGVPPEAVEKVNDLAGNGRMVFHHEQGQGEGAAIHERGGGVAMCDFTCNLVYRDLQRLMPRGGDPAELAAHKVTEHVGMAEFQRTNCRAYVRWITLLAHSVLER